MQRNPGNAEAWSLLGTVQAENDDDQQAIAAMNRWVVGAVRQGGVGWGDRAAGPARHRRAAVFQVP